MRLLFVYSGNSREGISPFVKEQAEALMNHGIDVKLFPIVGKGLLGYAKNIHRLRDAIKRERYDVLHGHFLWSILVCLCAGRINKVGTFHGTDLNTPLNKFLARCFVVPFLDATIVVNEKMSKRLFGSPVYVIPCGVDTNLFAPNDTSTTSIVRSTIKEGALNILFASRFDRYEKNYKLASKTIDFVSDTLPCNLIELKEFTRSEVSELLNAVDLLLLTSLWEGSPQVVKEAMACNCPIVTTDVGDVRWLLMGLDNCEVCSHDAKELSEAIVKIYNDRGRTNGRSRIESLHLSNDLIARRIINVYEELIK